MLGLGKRIVLAWGYIIHSFSIYIFISMQVLQPGIIAAGPSNKARLGLNGHRIGLGEGMGILC